MRQSAGKRTSYSDSADDIRIVCHGKQNPPPLIVDKPHWRFQDEAVTVRRELLEHRVSDENVLNDSADTTDQFVVEITLVHGQGHGPNYIYIYVLTMLGIEPESTNHSEPTIITELKCVAIKLI